MVMAQVSAAATAFQCCYRGAAAVASDSAAGGATCSVATSLPLPCHQFKGDRVRFLPRNYSSRGGAAVVNRGRLRIDCVGWDPENILGPPQPGHISRRSFEKSFINEEERKFAVEQAARADRERRRIAREARSVPTTNAGLVDFFLETEGQEMEYEIARCRPRLNDVFFNYLKSEIGLLRFGLNPQEGADDRLVELEELQKVLLEGAEAYDRLASDFTGAKDRLMEILASKNKRATLLELAGQNKLDRPVLALLDENIAAASNVGQKQAAEFMSKIREAMVKYMTV